jgi:probable RNA-binding protein EIF1AD
LSLCIMAGLGRRTHYRKHLTDSVMNDLPVPQQDERIAKVVATRGGNHFDILLSSAEEDMRHIQTRKPRLCILPTKFRKLVFIKRGDFVIVETSVGYDAQEEATADKEGGVRCIVKHILYKDQIKNLKAKDLWPLNDPEFNDEKLATNEHEAPDSTSSDRDGTATDLQNKIDDGIVYDSMYADEEIGDDLMLNTNRMANLVLQDSSDSEQDN